MSSCGCRGTDAKATGVEAGRSISVTFIEADGVTETTVQAAIGTSLLEVAHAYDIELEGARRPPAYPHAQRRARVGYGPSSSTNSSLRASSSASTSTTSIVTFSHRYSQFTPSNSMRGHVHAEATRLLAVCCRDQRCSCLSHTERQVTDWLTRELTERGVVAWVGGGAQGRARARWRAPRVT